MIPGQKDGTSSLTVSSAAAAFEGFLSAEETQETETANPETKSEAKPDDAAIEAANEDEADDTATENDVDADTEQGADDEEIDEDDEDPEEQSRPRTHRLKIDGEDVEVTEDELKKGYSRHADYTRKTQAVAEERKKLDAEVANKREVAQRYAARLAEVETALRATVDAEPDWDALRHADPAEFAATWAAHQQQKERINAVNAERAQVLADLQAEEAEHRKAVLKHEAEQLVKVIPEWTNADVAKKEKADLVQHALERGFSQDDLAQVADHRIIKLLRDAMLFQKGQVAAKEKQPLVQRKIEKVKTAAPGTAPTVAKRKVSETTRAKQRLAKTGRVSDAAVLFEQFV